MIDDASMEKECEENNEFTQGFTQEMNTDQISDKNLEHKVSKCPQGKLLYMHYEKPMNTKFVIQRGTAISERDTRTIHTQDLIRVMRNNHRDIPKVDKDETVSKYMKKLKNSGFDRKYRVGFFCRPNLCLKNKKRRRGEKGGGQSTEAGSGKRWRG